MFLKVYLQNYKTPTCKPDFRNRSFDICTVLRFDFGYLCRDAIWIDRQKDHCNPIVVLNKLKKMTEHFPQTISEPNPTLILRRKFFLNFNLTFLIFFDLQNPTFNVFPKIYVRSNFNGLINRLYIYGLILYLKNILSQEVEDLGTSLSIYQHELLLLRQVQC